MKKLVILILVLIGLSAAALGQFPQMQRAEERRQQMIRADEERQRAEADGKPKQPVITPAVMNVDVQLVLAKLEYKTFAAAKPFATTRVADGDPLWLYIKFNGNLGRYAHTMRNPEGGERYVLFVEYGPQGDVTAKSHYMLEFRKDELAMTEIKLSLSPGKAGHNNALPIFIRNVGTSRPGLWNNELRITRTPGFPRSINDYLAKAAFTCDFSRGLIKYPAMIDTFRSMVLRDTLDETKLPLEGKFNNTLTRTALIEMIASEGIAPSRVYFAGDNWQEYSDLPTSVRQYRTITGTFLYQNAGGCFYGTGEITQTYDAMNDAFGETKINLRKDIAISCTPPK